MDARRREAKNKNRACRNSFRLLESLQEDSSRPSLQGAKLGAMKADQGLSNEAQPFEIYSINDKLPRWGQCVVVVTPCYNCRGFLDPRGEWRDAGDGSVIENVLSWYPPYADGSHTPGEQSRSVNTG